MTTRELRIVVSEGAILSPTQAASLLGFRDATAWLRREGLVSSLLTPDGRTIERVVWRSVLRRLEAASTEAEREVVAPKPVLQRLRVAERG